MSLGRARPEKSSLGKFKLCDNNKLIRGEEEYQFKSIHYDKHILNWINKASIQIASITNLSVGLTQYKDVILKLYNNYKEKVMGLQEYIAAEVNQHADKNKLYKTMKMISNEYQTLRTEVMTEFFTEAQKRLEQKLEGTDWSLSLTDKAKKDLISGSKWGFPMMIQESGKSQVVFGFEFYENNSRDPAWGVVRKNTGVDIKDLRQQTQDVLDKAENLLEEENSWWLKKGYYDRGDFFEKIIGCSNVEEAAEDFSVSLLKVFHNYKDVIIKCNEILDAKG